ncbi:formylglycine-generating enzyme family protein [Saccharibacillus brassicae]|uniref:Formylglycine-generating enzyme family protein n=1 Tax=Saccharibacillus brassicae TaxID=2583377 RepID=A0A4Y6URG9_SACBS|nr:formylglycine-generating enzyme family protein [Saccharibacillus brassicae]QDH20243.1 formylglycine-generating enzyme family protein [Saccharibacillus brassicae]
MENWTRPAWSRLTAQEKTRQMELLCTRLPVGFEWIGLETFERFGLSTKTGLFACEDTEFVFVPGDTVTLGWDAVPDTAEPLSGTHRQMLHLLRELGVPPEETEARMRDWVSPVRRAEIRPMLVERRCVSAAWNEWPIGELDPAEDADMLKAVEAFRQSPHSSLESDQEYLLEREHDSIRLYAFDDSEHFEEWSAGNIGAGLDLPSEDEWEYLYGSGSRTFFPWGDDIDPSMRLRHLPSAASGAYDLERPNAYDLEQPNGFGLCFPGDPYKKELVRTAGGWTGKGGDGGSNVHGGFGPFASYLPTGTFFRDPFEPELDWSEWLSSLVFRRIVRL